MSNPFKKVDEFFTAFIDDEANRFFVMNLPFWSFVTYITWHLVEYLGLYLIWAGLVFVLTPYIMAVIVYTIYNQDKSEYYETPLTFFRFTLAGYLVSVLTLIGIPGWYFGYLMKWIQAPPFNELYWKAIVIWFRVFNFYYDWKNKELQEFANSYSFKYQTWAWSFFMSSVVIVPGIFYWLYSNAREKAEIEEKERVRLAAATEQKRIRDEAREKDVSARQLAYEERQNREQEIEKEKQQKLEAKLKEVRAKDPWDSGFL